MRDALVRPGLARTPLARTPLARTSLARSSPTRHRSAVPGTELQVLVLAPGRRGCVGVDLDSGAFVRVHHRDAGRPLKPFVIGVGTVSPERIDRHEQPEAVDIAEPLQPVGALSGRRLQRVLEAIEHPRNRPLFGVHGATIPSWSLDGDRSTVALVPVGSDLGVHVGPDGVHCSFLWQGTIQRLRFEDPRLLARLDWLPRNPLRADVLREVLGLRPANLVVALSRPRQGHCYKVVAAALPRR